MSAGTWLRARTVWLPTWRLWLLLLLLAVLTTGWVMTHVHGWLAVSRPVEDAKYVVVEGWTPDYVARQALDWSKQHGVKLIFTTGILFDKGAFLSNYPTYAEMCADTLKHFGADPAMVKTAPAPETKMGRTRAMAQKLKEKLDAEAIPAGERKINIFTSGPHAFRSWMNFKRALGPGWQVGIVSVPMEGYDAAKWWQYSEGVKNVVEESMGTLFQAVVSK